MRLWRLDRILSVDLLDRGFQRREDFNLSDYAAQSFGVFQEEPFDVVLRFRPEAADDAERWLFHPTQDTRRQTDGSSTVCFRAGGMQEMCNHLFTWGTAVTVVEPEKLRRHLAELAESVTMHHGVQCEQSYPTRGTPLTLLSKSSMDSATHALVRSRRGHRRKRC